MAEHGAMREGHRGPQGNPRTAAPEGGGVVIEERAILAALERIARMQDSIRSGMDICRDTGLVFLRVYYEQLPPNVARRLRATRRGHGGDPRATSTEGTAQDRQRLGEKLASDAATAQIMRAMNVYRARIGYGPQEGGDGTEAAGGDMMPKGKKRLTQREKAERAAIKKQLQADGVLTLISPGSTARSSPGRCGRISARWMSTPQISTSARRSWQRWGRSCTK